MLTLGLTLLVAGIALLALALRGRVTARGRFCRKCRFDLRGLAHDAACPECGRDVNRAGGARPDLRAFRRWPAAGGATLLLLSAGVLLTALPAARAWLLPRVPDEALVWLHRADIPGSDHEVLARLADPQAERPSLRGIIRRDLVRVLTANAPPGASERLTAALAGGQFGVDQAQRLFDNALRIDVAIRSTVAPGETTIPVAVIVREDLFAAIGLSEHVSGPKPLYSYQMSAWVERGDDREVLLERTEPASLVRSSRGWHSHALPLTGAQQAALAAGEAVPITVGAQVQVVEARTGTIVATVRGSASQRVRAAENPSEAVRLIEDHRALRELAANMLVHAPSFTGFNHGPPAPNQMFLDGGVTVMFPLTNHFAYTVTVIGPGAHRFDDPNPLVLPNDDEGYHARGTDLIFLGVPPKDGESPHQLFARWESAETVDIVLTPDRSAAYQHPMIDAILAGRIIFRAVPLQRSVNGVLPPPGQRPWVTGEPLPTSESP
jgi:hypothetical protein